MILEIATISVKEDQMQAFENTFKKAVRILASTPGYISHELQRCLEVKGKYQLLVRWQTLEAHTVGFRGSEGYKEWRAFMNPYFNPPPQVEHFEQVDP